MKIIGIFFTAFFGFILVACGGSKSSTSAPAAAPASVFTPGGTVGKSSSATTSGAVGVFTSNGATYSVSPAATGSAGSANLLSLPNSGSMVGVVTTTQVQKTPIVTSLKDSFGMPAAINGTAVDPANDLGIAFNYNVTKISLFKLSTATEIATYDTGTVNTLSFSGASLKIAGAVMNPVNKTMILATADGFQVLDYSTPTAPALLRTIASNKVNPTTGVEIMENFAFDAQLPAGAMIITGGKYSWGSTDPVMALVDANTGQIYRPDAATALLFTVSQYIDAAAVDTNYHVAILADEGTGTTFVDLNKLTLNTAAGTYTLPAIGGVSRIITYSKMDNLALESTNHLLMMGQGCGGTSTVIAQLNDPAVALGFLKQATLTMPSGNDNLGQPVSFYNTCDPHSAGAYISDASSPTQPNTSKALWLSGDGIHIANINLQNVLNGVLASGLTYNPMAANPQDISYFAIP